MPERRHFPSFLTPASNADIVDTAGTLGKSLEPTISSFENLAIATGVMFSFFILSPCCGMYSHYNIFIPPLLFVRLPDGVSNLSIAIESKHGFIETEGDGGDVTFLPSVRFLIYYIAEVLFSGTLGAR